MFGIKVNSEAVTENFRLTKVMKKSKGKSNKRDSIFKKGWQKNCLYEV